MWLVALYRGVYRSGEERIRILGPYYKSKLEPKSNSNEILPVNCKFICYSTQFKLTKLKLEVLKSDF